MTPSRSAASTSSQPPRREVLSLADFHRIVSAGKLTVYAIIDATGDPRIPAKMDDLGARAACLWRGRAFNDYWAIAPYLAEVDHEVLSWILEELADEPWGVFVISELDQDETAKHLRRLFWIEGPDDRRLYFRYYDPRVIGAFLDACTPDEARDFFGPITAFGMTALGSIILRSSSSPV